MMHIKFPGIPTCHHMIPGTLTQSLRRSHGITWSLGHSHDPWDAHMASHDPWDTHMASHDPWDAHMASHDPWDTHTIPETLTWHHIIPGTLTWHHMIPGTLTWHHMIPETLTWHHMIPETLTWYHMIPGMLTCSSSFSRWSQCLAMCSNSPATFWHCSAICLISFTAKSLSAATMLSLTCVCVGVIGGGRMSVHCQLPQYFLHLYWFPSPFSFSTVHWFIPSIGDEFRVHQLGSPTNAQTAAP